jgi:hypothetical protein
LDFLREIPLKGIRENPYTHAVITRAAARVMVAGSDEFTAAAKQR